MQMIRRSEDRGHARWDWLDSHHTFSFADYHDDTHMGFGPLRVINEDRVAPGAGFPRHPHRNMEIVSYALSGAIEHKDSMGNGSVIAAGEIQYMSAGTGVLHSEYNASKTEPAHFLQIWIIPDKLGTKPDYAQKRIDESRRAEQWGVLLSPDGRDDSIAIKRNAWLLSSKLSAGKSLSYTTESGRGLWLHVAKGEIAARTAQGEQRLGAGDALALVNEPLELTASQASELLLFDVDGGTL